MPPLVSSAVKYLNGVESSRDERIKKAEQYSSRGYDFCKYGKYAAAVPLYKKAAELDPGNHKYWYNTAVAYDRMGDYAGMEGACKKTIECDPTFAKGHIRLAKALMRQDKVDAAGEAVTTGLLFDEKNAELLVLRQEVREKQEELSRAAIQRLEKEEPRKPELRRGVTDPSAIVPPRDQSHHRRHSDATPIRSPPSRKPPAKSKLNSKLIRDPPGPTVQMINANRDHGLPRFKDQVGTYVVSPSKVEEVPKRMETGKLQKQPARKAPPSKRTNNGKDNVKGHRSSRRGHKEEYVHEF